MRHIVFCHYNLLPYHAARYRGYLKNSPTAKVSVLLMERTEEYLKIDEATTIAKELGVAITRLSLGKCDSKKKMLAVAKQFLIESKVDTLVIFGGYTQKEMVALTVSAQDLGVKVVQCSESKQDDFTRNWFSEKLKSLVFQNFDSLLVGGTKHREYAVSLNVDGARVFTGYDVVDNHFFECEARPRTNERGAFLASCRFIQRKNIEGLVRAYSKYVSNAKSPRKLVILGGGPLEDEIEGLISGLKLNASVLTPGFVQYAGLKEYYHNAFCFVHPASKDQWGLVVNEAMAAGLPVLVSSGCGCAFDLVEDGENGFVFDPTDTDKLAHLLLKMDEECDAFEFGQKSRLKIRDFSPNSFGRSLSRAISFSFEMPANPSFLSRLALRLYLSFLLIKNKKHV